MHVRRPQNRNPGETVASYLARELPPTSQNDAEYFAKAIKEAGERYDRYDETRAEWEKYRSRRKNLLKLRESAEKLYSVLCSLDILTRDDLASRVGSERIDSLVGLLAPLHKRAGDLESKLQYSGKPKDLASERWILEMADIFENAFSKPPSVSGSGEDPTYRRGRFYRLLELGRPSRFARHGRLSSKHVQKILKTRSPPRTSTVSWPEDVRVDNVERP